MSYIKPDVTNINFELSSGYSPPAGGEIFFSLGVIEPTISGGGLFEGSVFEINTAMSGTALHLYRHSTGEFVSSTVTSSSGIFTLPWDVDDEYYFIVALYPNSEQNALIYDYLYATTSGA